MSVRQALENSMKQAAASSGSVLLGTIAGTDVNSRVSPYPYPCLLCSLFPSRFLSCECLFSSCVALRFHFMSL